jgi:hypothetical protein
MVAGMIAVSGGWPQARAMAALLLLPWLPALAVVCAIAFKAAMAEGQSGGLPGDSFAAEFISAVESKAAYSPHFQMVELRDRLPQWEQRYGDDPRFWMARYQILELGDWRAEDSLSSEQHSLHQPLIRKIADVSVLLCILARTQEAAAADVVETTQATNVRRRRPLADDATEYYRAVRQIIDTKYSLSFNAVSKLLAETGAYSAVAQYFLATTAYERGDLMQAMELVCRGNAAGDMQAHRAFPDEGTLQGLAHKGRYRLAVGSLQRRSQYDVPEYPNWHSYSSMAHGLAREALAQGDFPALDELHRMGCRVGLLANLDPQAALYASTGCIKAVATEVIAELGSRMDTRQLAIVSAVQQGTLIGGAVAANNLYNSSGWNPVLAPPSSGGNMIARLERALGGPRAEAAQKTLNETLAFGVRVRMAAGVRAGLEHAQDFSYVETLRGLD